MSKLYHEDITGAIIGSAFEAYNTLGYGFLEKVYQKALQIEYCAEAILQKLSIPSKLNTKVRLLAPVQPIYL